MYGAATFKMTAVIGLDQLDWLPKISLGVALLAWTTTFLGLIWQGADSLRSRRQRARTSA
jgi:hypothetical protein